MSMNVHLKDKELTQARLAIKNRRTTLEKLRQKVADQGLDTRDLDEALETLADVESTFSEQPDVFRDSQ